MNGRQEPEREIEAIIADAKDESGDEDSLITRMDAFVRRDPTVALEIGEGLAESPDPDRREIGLRLVEIAGVLDDYARRERALPILRRALARDDAVDPIAVAIIELGHLDDEASHDAILARVAHPDAVVRHAVTFALPSVGFDDAVLAALLELMRDPDEDVRDWATFGVGTLGDSNDERIRQALLDRLDDPNPDARIEAIAGLARRQDERVRPHLAAELARPDHGWIFDEALQDLDLGTNVPDDGWRTPSVRRS